MINDPIIKYVSCCKLWLEFHKSSNIAALLRYKLTDPVYYKLLQDFNIISIKFNNFNTKQQLTSLDINTIEEELIKFNDFFDIMSIIDNVMNK